MRPLYSDSHSSESEEKKSARPSGIIGKKRDHKILRKRLIDASSLDNTGESIITGDKNSIE